MFCKSIYKMIIRVSLKMLKRDLSIRHKVLTQPKKEYSLMRTLMVKTSAVTNSDPFHLLLLLLLLFLKHGLVLPECSLESLIIFLKKDVSESLRLLHLTKFLRIEWIFMTRFQNIALILIILFLIITGEVSQLHSYERVF